MVLKYMYRIPFYYTESFMINCYRLQILGNNRLQGKQNRFKLEGKVELIYLIITGFLARKS